MEALRDCPNCEQGKHQICTELVLAPEVPIGQLLNNLSRVVSDDDCWVTCPCAERNHTKEEA